MQRKPSLGSIFLTVFLDLLGFGLVLPFLAEEARAGFGGALSTVAVHGRHGPLACYVAAGLSVINFGWAYFGLGESLPKERRSTSKRSLSPLDVSAARATFALPGVGTAVLVNFLIVL